MLAITIIPFVAFVAAVALLWNTAVGWTDLALLRRPLRVVRLRHHDRLPPHAHPPRLRGRAAAQGRLLVFGSIAIQGSAVDWAVDHRTHHAFSDKEGDPHSPHHGFERSVVGGSCKGLRARAHGLDVRATPRDGPRALRQGPAGRPHGDVRRPHLLALGDRLASRCRSRSAG